MGWGHGAWRLSSRCEARQPASPSRLPCLALPGVRLTATARHIVRRAKGHTRLRLSQLGAHNQARREDDALGQPSLDGGVG